MARLHEREARGPEAETQAVVIANRGGLANPTKSATLVPVAMARARRHAKNRTGDVLKIGDRSKAGKLGLTARALKTLPSGSEQTGPTAETARLIVPPTVPETAVPTGPAEDPRRGARLQVENPVLDAGHPKAAHRVDQAVLLVA